MSYARHLSEEAACRAHSAGSVACSLIVAHARTDANTHTRFETDSTNTASGCNAFGSAGIRRTLSDIAIEVGDEPGGAPLRH